MTIDAERLEKNKQIVTAFYRTALLRAMSTPRSSSTGASATRSTRPSQLMVSTAYGLT